MKKTYVAAFVALSALFVTKAAVADEGMWQPHQLTELESVLKQRGLEISAESIARLTSFPMNAVISLGGCTASFVSDKGLAVTNHHCAYGSIQHNSSAEYNLLQQGFLARQFSEELPASPDARMFVTEAADNVTAQVHQQLSAELTGKARFEKLEQIRKALITECEQQPGYRCDVYSFHSGLEYYLIKQLEIRDVRLVYAPASGVGKFGGDVDNWSWPRHTGDFAFYRAYVGPDGKPADYAADNQPFTPPSFLKVSARGVNNGDFIMVPGYPGRTNRYRTAEEVRHQFTHIYPLSQQYRQQAIEVIRQYSAEGSDARLKYESVLASLANYAKNFAGMVQSYHSSAIQQRQDSEQQKLIKWIHSDKKRSEKYGPVVEQLNALIEQERLNQQRELVLSYFSYARLPDMAKRLYRQAKENEKPDAERDTGFQLRDQEQFTDRLKRLSRNIDPRVDLELALHFLRHYAQLPPEQRLTEFDRFFGIADGFNLEIVRHKLEGMYRKTTLIDEAERLGWLERSAAEFEQSDDPMLSYAVAMYQCDLAVEQKRKELAGQLALIRPQFMQAIIAFNKAQGKPVYADANGTLRVTFGTVKGYQPRDAVWYQPFTTAPGLLAKVTGVAPFNAPDRQVEALQKADFGRYQSKALRTLPVNFLSTADTTGGNSGSPTLNAKAELVGLLFDGVSESIIGDWVYDPQLNRSIHVDSRYMLWQMDKVDGAANVLNEMQIVY